MPQLWSTAPSLSAAAPEAPRVVVTGIGLVTGLGISREETWRNLREGRQGFRRLELGVANGLAPHVCCALPEGGGGPLAHLRRAAAEACSDAGLVAGSFDQDRAAVVVGLSKGDLGLLARAREAMKADRAEGSALGGWDMGWPDAGAVALARATGWRGPCLAPIAACATGLIAALRAADLIQSGVCDLALCGASDSSLDPLVLAAFRRMGVLAQVGSEPNRAVRPWDRGRSGFLVGEGAATLVLERAEHAHARGVLPYAEFAGGAFGADAFHATNLNPDHAGLAYLISLALRRADAAPGEIDHVNVHGTATRTNDPLECRALRAVLGPSADRVSCSANKAQIGHLLGAAGAAELAITCLAVRDAFVPPTLNLDDPDPACDLDGTPHVGRARSIGAALKLSIGFGGHLAAAVLRRPDGTRRSRTVDQDESSAQTPDRNHDERGAGLD